MEWFARANAWWAGRSLTRSSIPGQVILRSSWLHRPGLPGSWAGAASGRHRRHRGHCLALAPAAHEHGYAGDQSL